MQMKVMLRINGNTPQFEANHEKELACILKLITSYIETQPLDIGDHFTIRDSKGIPVGIWMCQKVE